MNGTQLLLLALGAIAIMAIGHRKGVQPNLIILVVSGAASFIPGLPRLELEPELILGAVMPPLLYSAALNFSFFTFMRNLRPILGLGVGMVLVTAGATGLFTAWLLPSLGLAGAFVLAAVVSPPDTVTTVTHGREMGLPRRAMAILTGESLVNDAAALALFALAIARVAGTHTFIENAVLLFLYEAGVGAILGLALGGVISVIRLLIRHHTLETALGLVLPFAAFLAAEQIHASGVIAVVMAAFSVGINLTYSRGTRFSQPNYRTRLQESEVWPVIDTLLEAFVFAYMGLQLRFVIEDVEHSGVPLGEAFAIGLVVLLLVMIIRVAWLFILFGRDVLSLRLWQWRLTSDPRARERVALREARRPDRGPLSRVRPVPLDWRENLVIAWIGMRGIVTLAAAGSIPLATASGAPFPGRAIIQFVAFIVAIGTILIQGSTVAPLIRALRIDLSAERREEEAALAEAEALAARATAAEGPATDAAGQRDRFDRQRAALSLAVRDRQVDDEAARVVIGRIDRREAAIDERDG